MLQVGTYAGGGGRSSCPGSNGGNGGQAGDTTGRACYDNSAAGGNAGSADNGGGGGSLFIHLPNTLLKHVMTLKYESSVAQLVEISTHREQSVMLLSQR